MTITRLHVHDEVVHRPLDPCLLLHGIVPTASTRLAATSHLVYALGAVCHTSSFKQVMVLLTLSGRQLRALSPWRLYTRSSYVHTESLSKRMRTGIGVEQYPHASATDGSRLNARSARHQIREDDVATARVAC